MIAETMIAHTRSKKKRSDAANRLDSLFWEIRERICLLTYAPGERLSENDLAREFGVSRTPIRRALTRLEGEGLIETHHGAGTYVTSLSTEFLAEIYELRIELSPLIGKLNPKKPSGETINALRVINKAISDLIGHPDLTAFSRLNVAYYLEIMKLVGNRPLRDILEKLFFQTSRIWLTELPRLDWDDVMRASCEEISHIIDALEAGDMEAVGLVARLNLQRTMRRYILDRREHPTSDGD
jgi:DNA-binding GntR family transcriptional regulator